MLWGITFRKGTFNLNIRANFSVEMETPQLLAFILNRERTNRKLSLKINSVQGGENGQLGLKNFFELLRLRQG